MVEIDRPTDRPTGADVDSIDRRRYEQQEQAWYSLAERWRRLIRHLSAERERLLGPDRGE